ncbi:MAG: hypothetical protein Q7S68_05230 [Deltaproteobacteria bacterium]|nr:hypothetical protein [Deltaproteobacteria bacterium]
MRQGGWTQQTTDQIEFITYFVPPEEHADLHYLLDQYHQARGVVEGEAWVATIAGYFEGHQQELQDIIQEASNVYFSQVTLHSDLALVRETLMTQLAPPLTMEVIHPTNSMGGGMFASAADRATTGMSRSFEWPERFDAMTKAKLTEFSARTQANDLGAFYCDIASGFLLAFDLYAKAIESERLSAETLEELWQGMLDGTIIPGSHLFKTLSGWIQTVLMAGDILIELREPFLQSGDRAVRSRIFNRKNEMIDHLARLLEFDGYHALRDLLYDAEGIPLPEPDALLDTIVELPEGDERSLPNHLHRTAFRYLTQLWQRAPELSREELYRLAWEQERPVLGPMTLEHLDQMKSDLTAMVEVGGDLVLPSWLEAFYVIGNIARFIDLPEAPALHVKYEQAMDWQYGEKEGLLDRAAQLLGLPVWSEEMEFNTEFGLVDDFFSRIYERDPLQPERDVYEQSLKEAEAITQTKNADEMFSLMPEVLAFEKPQTHPRALELTEWIVAILAADLAVTELGIDRPQLNELHIRLSMDDRYDEIIEALDIYGDNGDGAS